MEENGGNRMRPFSFTLLTVVVLGSVTLPVRAAGVEIEILEGELAEKSWDLDKLKVTDRYQEDGFGLTVVPAKYSPRGVQLDRSNPLVLRATQKLQLPAGEYRVLLRARGAARVTVDGKAVVALDFPPPGSDGHEVVPNLKVGAEKDLRQLRLGQRDKRATLQLDGKEHVFQWEIIIGGKKVRAEPGEAAIALSPKGKAWFLLGDRLKIAYTEEGWIDYRNRSLLAHQMRNDKARKTASVEEDGYWDKRHELARKEWQDQPMPAVPVCKTPGGNVVDHFLNKRLEEAGIKPATVVDDDTFLRRVMLDTTGVVPTPEELAAFRQDKRPDRRERVIEKLLADPRWADHWISYWQDVLAENPGILKPSLNNTGPFRWWLYDALSDNLAMDRFVTTLTQMEGSKERGAPSAFGIATENDVPMAAKAQTLARAFLAADLGCARCHDGPGKSGFKQEQLFSLAAMLDRKSLAVPLSSTVKHVEGARKPAVNVTLKPGTKVPPSWQLDDLANEQLPPGVLRDEKDERERVAALLTSPRNERFAQVLVNRVWKRYLGLGLVEPVDDWRRAKPTHPELLTYLGRELITHNYDLKHVARLILESNAYQRTIVPPDGEAGQKRAELSGTPTRRRLSAEQLVDSLFVAAGKEFGCEELTFDPDGRRPANQMINLGTPTRAWQFTGLANERDRPALSLPVASTFVDTLMAYGWRESRPSTLTIREESPTALQPMILANGLVHKRAARLCDESAFTALALREQSLDELVTRLCERILTRKPTGDEKRLFVEALAEGYEGRRTGKPALPKVVKVSAVSWSNHLHPEATRQKLQEEEAARAGDHATPRLQTDWRERLEDVIWALFNSPEFAFAP